MKKIFVLDQSGNKLFEGSRHDAKHFIKRRALTRFKMVERFEEKAVVEPEKFEETEENKTFINRIFG